MFLLTRRSLFPDSLCVKADDLAGPKGKDLFISQIGERARFGSRCMARRGAIGTDLTSNDQRETTISVPCRIDSLFGHQEQTDRAFDGLLHPNDAVNEVFAPVDQFGDEFHAVHTSVRHFAEGGSLPEKFTGKGIFIGDEPGRSQGVSTKF